jgi:sucrose phosphorylase
MPTPDSIGGKLADTVSLLPKPELKDLFSLFYILPTFFNSDLDRVFSIIDYDLNRDLVSENDIDALKGLGITFKFDLILNHLSVASPQFQDLLEKGDSSDYKNFFVDWNAFWCRHGEMGDSGYIVPRQEYLDKLFMRKPGLPILKVGFPDGSERPYWNTFYQQVSYHEVTPQDFSGIRGVTRESAPVIAALVNENIEAGADPEEMNLNGYDHLKHKLLPVLEKKRRYLGQMDLNAGSEQVWAFYEETLKKLKQYGAKIIRLDAFAYLHKGPVNATFFSALGEDERKLRLARAIQLFMPGIPQIWYLDLFAGRNDYAAADLGGPAGHKEINRSNSLPGGDRDAVAMAGGAGPVNADPPAQYLSGLSRGTGD